MTTELKRRIEGFLDAHHVTSLATLGPDGPHAANLFYARDGLTLVWVSETATRHSLNLGAAPLVSATVAPDTADFAAIQGLQIAGSARQVTDAAERARLLALLEARYPFLRQLKAAPEKLREAYARTGVYCLTPTRIVFIDNTQGFGHKETLDLPRIE